MADFALSKEELEALAKKCYRSRVEFMRIFLPDWFPTKMPWVHRGILALLTNKTEFLLDFGQEIWRDEVAEWTMRDLEKILTNFIDARTGQPIFRLTVEGGSPEILLDVQDSVAIVMPRGYSKTTLLNGNTVAEGCYHDTDFFLYLSEAAPHAQRQLETVKAEFEANEMIRLVFGDKVPPRQSSMKWSADYIETTDGIQIGAIGTGGKVRGFSKHAKRPQIMLFDDLQDEESVESPTEREKASRWFFRAARPAKRKGGRDLIIGTLLHPEQILAKCIRLKEFTAVIFGAVDRQGDMLWDFMIDKQKLEEMREAAHEVGEVQGFYLEYMSEFRDDETRIFPEGKMIYVHKGLEHFTAISQAMDPALSDSKRASAAAMAVVGIEARGFKHVIDYHEQKGMDPYDLLEKYFEHHLKWISHLPLEQQRHGIEAIQFQAALLPMMRTLMVEKSRQHGQKAYFEVTPITHGKTQKETRVKGILKPTIWTGFLTFEQRWGKLHSQFTDFTGKGGQAIDGMDAIAMAVALLDPYVMLGLEDEGAKLDLANDNAPPLETVLGGSFRSAP